ncbi:MAG: AraC family transcriptional regulator [Gorillibacterium sp.]|nr:AraC family transcriptional regulator [Gorillibacterium sp.]
MHSEQAKALLKGSNHFREGFPIYINRVEETFDLDFHTHDFIEITYVCEGKGYHHIGEQVVPVSKGELFVIPIGIPHVFRPVSASRSDRLVVYNCIFTEQALKSTADTVGDFTLATALRLHLGEQQAGYGILDRELSFEPIFQSMLEEHTTKKPGFTAVLHSLLGWLLILLARKLEQPDDVRFEAADAIGETMDYIRHHVAEDLNLQALAERSRLSERHFFRLFKQRTGQTFHSFVQQARVRTACEYLAGTTLKISAIAENVGYKDLQSFYRVFKQVVGTTPGEYRNKRLDVQGRLSV